MTKDTPKWPGEMPTEGMRIDVERENKTWNQSRAACIAAFEEWQKGRELKGEVINDFLKVVAPSLSTFERNFAAYKIAKRFGVRGELGELDMSRVTKLVRKFTDCDIDDKRCLLDREEIRILQSSGVRKVPTVEEIKKTMIRAKHGEAAFTTTKYKMDVLRKQAEAVHRLITEGYVHEAEEG